VHTTKINWCPENNAFTYIQTGLNELVLDQCFKMIQRGRTEYVLWE